MSSHRRGFIYILTNPSMPGLIKIGMTTRNPHSRARELSNATGVPTRFTVSYQRQTDNCQLLEQRIHQRLVRYRVALGKEFFQIPIGDAIQIINSEIDKQVTGEVQKAPDLQLTKPIDSKSRLTDLFLLPFRLPVWLWQKNTAGRLLVLVGISPLLCMLTLYIGIALLGTWVNSLPVTASSQPFL